MRLVSQLDCRSSETSSIPVRGAGSEAMVAERFPSPSDEVRFLAGPPPIVASQLQGGAKRSGTRSDRVPAPPERGVCSRRTTALPTQQARFDSGTPLYLLQRRVAPGATQSAKSWSAVQLRGAPPNASARGRDQRLLNAGLRDRHAPEALCRIRLVAQDAGFSIRQRQFDSVMRRHVSTHGGRQVYEASSGGSTPPGDTKLFVVGRSRRSERCAPGSTPGEETAGG